MKKVLIFVGLMFFSIFAFCIIDTLKAENDKDIHEQIISQEQLYCQEIDSLCASYGFEVDADKYDIWNATSMEQAGYFYLGDKFYTWRQTKSQYAWEFDVLIARYCY